MISKPTLVDSTYKRDGKWYTLRVIDRSNQSEVDATDGQHAHRATGTVDKLNVFRQ